VNQAYQFGVFIPPDTDHLLAENARRRVADILSGRTPVSGKNGQPEITLFFDPTLRGVFRSAMRNGLEGVVSAVQVQLQMEALTAQLPAHLASVIEAEIGIDLTEELTRERPPADWGSDPPPPIVEKGALAGFSDALPTTVQQNVPAWALFGMFFIVVPLAGSLIQERNDMTLVRLLTMPVSYLTVATGKVSAYVLVCLLQFAIIAVVGKTVLPAMGTPVLYMGASPAGILLITLCAALAACGFGILLGTVARSFEQAAMSGSILIVIAAALGGILVPVYVMPKGIQQISAFSPMAWGLEGYLDLFVRNGSVADILPEATLLLAFFAASVLAAWSYFNRRVM
jgi:ABC-2 type transport system permease protein